MDILKLGKLQAEEDERASHQAKKVKRRYADKGMTWAVREIYSDKIKLPAGHAYHQSGSLGTTTFLNEKTIVEVFPYKDPSAFIAGTGLSVEEMKLLAKERIIEILIHSYPAYEGLDFLDPILAFEPACYQSRGRTFLNSISEGQFDEWFEMGIDSKYLKMITKKEFVREPYEKELSYPIAEIRRKTAWRYAAMRCLIGQKVVDDIIEVHREKAPNYINELHTIFLHPITHGMLGDPFSSVVTARDLHNRKYVEILDSLERIMIQDVGVVLPDRISAKTILRSHEQGLAREFSRVRNTIFRDLIQDLVEGKSSTEDVKSKLRSKLADLNDRVRQIEVIGKTTERGLVLGLLAGGTVCLSQGFGTLAALLFGSMQATPYIMEPLAKSYSRIFEPAVSHYWSLKSVAKRAKQN